MKKAFVKKLIKIVVAVLLTCVILVNLATVIFSKLGLRRQLDWMSGAFVTVESGSMEPDLNVGDLVFVWHTSFDDLKVGDVITFYSGNEYVTHGITRIEDEQVITMGKANELIDAPVNEKDYCAKVLFVIPGGATVWDILTDTKVLVLCLVLLFALFYAMPIFSFIYDKVTKNADDRKRVGVVRVLTSLALASLFITTPFMSSARYVAEINGLEFAYANAVYFSSNYLTEKGNNYHLQGWAGKQYDMTLELRNYANELIYNREDHDVRFKIEYEMDIAAEYAQAYKITINPPEGVLPDDNDYYTLEGVNEEKQSMFFSVCVMADDQEIGLAPNSKIHFMLKAITDPDVSYSRTLLGSFEFEVASNSDFIGASELQHATGNTLITYTIKTNNILGGSQKKILLKWDATRLYLNEYDPTAIDYIERRLAPYDDGKSSHVGSLELAVESYSSFTLQFYLYSDHISEEIEAVKQPSAEGDDTIEIHLVLKNGSLPIPVEPESTSESETEPNP